MGTPWREIQDGQPTMTEHHAPFCMCPDSVGIRTALSHVVHHDADPLFAYARYGVQRDTPRNTAHARRLANPSRFFSQRELVECLIGRDHRPPRMVLFDLPPGKPAQLDS